MIKRALVALGLVGAAVQALVTAVNLFYHWRPDRSYELAGLGPGKRAFTIAEMPPPDASSSPDQSVVEQCSDQDGSRPHHHRIVVKRCGNLDQRADVSCSTPLRARVPHPVMRAGASRTPGFSRHRLRIHCPIRVQRAAGPVDRLGFSSLAGV